MVMVVRHVHKLTQKPFKMLQLMHNSDQQSKRRMNALVTSAHIVLILSFTILSFLIDNVFIGFSSAADSLTACLFISGGLLDIFVAYMMFFIFSEDNRVPDLIRDESRHISYPVLNVIKTAPRIS